MSDDNWILVDLSKYSAEDYALYDFKGLRQLVNICQIVFLEWIDLQEHNLLGHNTCHIFWKQVGGGRLTGKSGSGEMDWWCDCESGTNSGIGKGVVVEIGSHTKLGGLFWEETQLGCPSVHY